MKAKETQLEKQKEDLNGQLKEALDKMEHLYTEIKSLERYKGKKLNRWKEKKKKKGIIHFNRIKHMISVYLFK